MVLRKIVSSLIIKLFSPVGDISRTFSSTTASTFDVNLMLEEELICENGHLVL